MSYETIEGEGWTLHTEPARQWLALEGAGPRFAFSIGWDGEHEVIAGPYSPRCLGFARLGLCSRRQPWDVIAPWLRAELAAWAYVFAGACPPNARIVCELVEPTELMLRAPPIDRLYPPSGVFPRGKRYRALLEKERAA